MGEQEKEANKISDLEDMVSYLESRNNALNRRLANAKAMNKIYLERISFLSDLVVRAVVEGWTEKQVVLELTKPPENLA